MVLHCILFRQASSAEKAGCNSVESCACYSLITLNSSGHCTVLLIVILIQSCIQVCEGSLVLVFECSEEVMAGRPVERGKTSGRVDDNEETIRKRLTTYIQ